MDSYRAGKWEISLNQGKMLGSEALDTLSNTLGIKLPEIVFNDSSFRLVNDECGVCYYINAVKALEMTGFEKRNKSLYNTGELKEDNISMIPSELRVAMASHWEGRTIPKNTTFSEGNSEQVVAKVCDFGND